MIIFAVYAYTYYEKKNEKLAIVFLSLAILFQPLLPIHLGRTLWNIIDVIVAIFLVVLYFKENSSLPPENRWWHFFADSASAS